MQQHQHKIMTDHVTKGVTGMIAVGGGLGLSLTTINQVLQTGSLLLGMTIGGVTLWKMFNNKNKD